MTSETLPGVPTGDPSFSLTHALAAVADQGGVAIDADDLHAALGLSMMMVAVPEEADPGSWPAYARDAFLIEAGRLFGLEIRAIHPPEAARGLTGVEEFRQHFQASYRPLIARALEHDQPVLVWQGWSGDRAGMWGVITGTDPGEIGFVGGVADPGRGGALGEVLPLTRVPVQFYVVERAARSVPAASNLLAAAIARARRVFGNEIGDRFGVVTGVPAYDLWIRRLEVDAAPSEARPDKAVGHRRLAASVVAGHESAIRFLQRRQDGSPDEASGLRETLLRGCQGVIASLSEVNEGLADTPAGRAQLARQISNARDEARNMLAALPS